VYTKGVSSVKVHNNLPRKEVTHPRTVDKVSGAIALLASALVMSIVIIQLAKFIGGKL
jgi:hypothetical protein